MIVNAIAAGTAARSAAPYLTFAFGMNLYIAENVKVTIMPKINQAIMVLNTVSDSLFNPNSSSICE